MKSKKPRKPSWYQRFIRRLNAMPCTVLSMSTRQLRRLAIVHHEHQQRFLPRQHEARERDGRRYRESREALGLPVRGR